jgi:hypothetical protein
MKKRGQAPFFHALAIAVYGCALAVVLAVSDPWSDDDRLSPAAPRAEPTQPPRPRSPGPPIPERGPVPEELEEPEPRTPRPFPRVAPSADPLPPEQPVPAPPPLALLTTLGDCCSESRQGRRIDAIVIHTTESADEPGDADLRRLYRFFLRRRLATHVADDATGTSIRLVPDALLAYHATYWNVSTVGIEQVGDDGFSRATWFARRPQLDTTARWVAYWARRYRIPIRRCVVDGIRYNRRKKGRVIAGRIVKRGVCSHAQLDPRNRKDPGRGYPWDYVLAKAREIARAAG